MSYGRSQIINFRETASSGSEVWDKRRSEVSGKMDKVYVYFPPGCNSLVDVAVYVNSTQVVPDKGFLSLDGANLVLNPNCPVNVGDTISVHVVNTDGAYSHTITVVCQINNE